MAQGGNSELAALEKRMDAKFEVIANELKEIKTNMAKVMSDMSMRFDEVLNALQELRKNEETTKNNGSNEQKDGFEIVCATTETQRQNQENNKKEIADASEVETEYCKVQIWSKQNVSLALKMRGITVRWRRSRAAKDSRIAIKEKSHRTLMEKEQPSERKGMELHKSPLGVRKEHHHRCSIGGGIINRRAALNKRRQKQLAIARKFKNLKPPWSMNENCDEQRLVIWESIGKISPINLEDKVGFQRGSIDRPLVCGLC